MLLVKASSAAIKSFSVNLRPPLGVMVPEMAELSESDRLRVCFMTKGKGYEVSSSSSWVPCQAVKMNVRQIQFPIIVSGASLTSSAHVIRGGKPFHFFSQGAYRRATTMSMQTWGSNVE